MTDLSNQVHHFLQKVGLYEKGRSVLVAVSGGVDSMVLLHLLNELEYKTSVAHCNFKLRGKIADEDEAFVKEHCFQHNLPFYSQSFDTEGYAVKKKISIQMAARSLRYAYFEEVRSSKSLDLIAVGTHLNDQIETVLLNLTKGTGLTGLTGIKPYNKRIIRPLLECSKQAIISYAESQSISYREDDSNTNNKYQRNRIRNLVIPELKKINPELEASFSQSLNYLRSDEEAKKSAVQKAKKEIITYQENGFYFSVPQLKPLPFRSAFLKEVLTKLEFTSGKVLEVEKLLEANTGKRVMSDMYEVVKDRDRLVVQPILSNFSPIVIDRIPFNHEQLGLTITSIDKPLFTSKKTTETIDGEKLKFPLTIRPWKKGDQIKPIGMKGKSKMVSDLLTDAKIPAHEKPHQLLIENGNSEIIWIMGLRVSETTKVTPTTNQFVKLELKY